MKIKWLMILIISVLILLIVPIKLHESKPIELTIGKVPVVVTVSSVTTRISGVVRLDSVNVKSKKGNCFVDRVEIKASIPKLLRLRKNEKVLRRFLDEMTIDSLVTHLMAGGMNSIRITNLTGILGSLPVENVDCTIRKRWGKIRGETSVGSCKIFGKTHEKQDIELSVAGKTLKLHQKGSIADGSIKSRIGFQMDTKSINYLWLEGKKLTIQKLLPYRISGTADIHCELTSGDSLPLTGTGIISITNMIDNSTPILAELTRTLKLVGVQKVAFDSVSIPFRYESMKIRVDSLRGEGKMFDAEGSGNIDLKKARYSFEMIGHLSSSMKSEVSPIIWGGLDPDPKNDGKKFNGTLSGVGENYSVKVDRRIIRQSARSFFKNIFN